MTNHLCPVKKISDRLKKNLTSGRVAGPVALKRTEDMLKLVDDLRSGRGRKGHIPAIEALAGRLLDEGKDAICVETGQMVSSLLAEHREVFQSHIDAHYCPAGDCTKLSAAPCQLACPANVDAPSYVALVGMGRYKDALEVLREDLPLPGSLGRVCVHPCERACRRGQVDNPIAICQLKRAAFDMAVMDGMDSPPPAPNRFEEKVAIIGGGPAGLATGYFLARRGYRPTIFESMPEAGGMLRWGIPAYRLPRDILRQEIAYIMASGVDIRTNIAFGEDITLDGLRQEGFKAFFIGIGACRSMALPVRGAKNNPHVIECLSFLRNEHMREKMVGKRVVVIGGGNAAVDCVRTALRMDLDEVNLVYRRSRQEMPAHSTEIEAAEQEGAILTYLSSPVCVHVENGRISGLECIRNELSEPDATGRRRPIPVKGTEYIIPTDTVITAIGQEVDTAPLQPATGLELSRNHLVTVNPSTMETSLHGVFAGGDVVSGPATVVEAVASGRNASESIHCYLRGLPYPREVQIPVRRKSVAVLNLTSGEKSLSTRPGMPSLEVDSRKKSFHEVELGLTGEDAVKEAKRCLRCDICIGCGECIQVCREEMGVEAIHLSYVEENGTTDTDFLRPAETCIGCGSCALRCPTGAITMEADGKEMVFSMCGAEMSRHPLLTCVSCGTPFVAQRHLEHIREKADAQVRMKHHRNLCPACARRIRAEDLVNKMVI